MIDAFATLLNGDSNVTEMAKCMTLLTAAAGRVILGMMQIKKIQTLVFWAKDHHMCNVDVDPEMWTAEEVAATVQKKEANKHNLEKIDINIIDPSKCQTDVGWDAWQIAFMNKLNATMGAAKVPAVAYAVLWAVVDDAYEFGNKQEEERMYQMPLTGENYKWEYKIIYNILKVACIKSDAWMWSHDRTSDGRKAWQSLVNY
jgi:hypothetical protein